MYPSIQLQHDLYHQISGSEDACAYIFTAARSSGQMKKQFERHSSAARIGIHDVGYEALLSTVETIHQTSSKTEEVRSELSDAYRKFIVGDEDSSLVLKMFYHGSILGSFGFRWIGRKRERVAIAKTLESERVSASHFKLHATARTTCFAAQLQCWYGRRQDWHCTVAPC